MKHPTRLRKNLLAEVTADIRFVSAVPPDVLVGVLYSTLEGEYGLPQPNPISQLPAPLRDSDPNLKYLPTHRFLAGDYILGCGARSISLTSVKYGSFDPFRRKLQDLLEKVLARKLIVSLERVGLRYVNVFPDRNVIDISNLDVVINKQSLREAKIHLRWEQEIAPAIVIVNVSNAAEVVRPDGKVSGSLLDIDVLVQNSDHAAPPTSGTIIDKLTRANVVANDVFFSTMREDFIKTLEPEYEE